MDNGDKGEEGSWRGNWEKYNARHNVCITTAYYNDGGVGETRLICDSATMCCCHVKTFSRWWRRWRWGWWWWWYGSDENCRNNQFFFKLLLRNNKQWNKMWISKPMHMKCFLEIKWYFSCLRNEKLNGAVPQLIEMHLSCWSKSTTDKICSSNSPGRENGYKSFSDKYFWTLKKRSFSFNLSTVNSNCIIHWMRVWKLKKPLNEKNRDGSLERRKRSG